MQIQVGPSFLGLEPPNWKLRMEQLASASPAEVRVRRACRSAPSMLASSRRRGWPGVGDAAAAARCRRPASTRMAARTRRWTGQSVREHGAQPAGEAPGHARRGPAGRWAHDQERPWPPQGRRWRGEPGTDPARPAARVRSRWRGHGQQVPGGTDRGGGWPGGMRGSCSSMVVQARPGRRRPRPASCGTAGASGAAARRTSAVGTASLAAGERRRGGGVGGGGEKDERSRDSVGHGRRAAARPELPVQRRGGRERPRRRRQRPASGGAAARRARSICRQNGLRARAPARASDPCDRRRLGSARAAVVRSCRLPSEHALTLSTTEATATLSLFFETADASRILFCSMQVDGTG